jgi:hypothetical protein
MLTHAAPANSVGLPIALTDSGPGIILQRMNVNGEQAIENFDVHPSRASGRTGWLMIFR